MAQPRDIDRLGAVNLLSVAVSIPAILLPLLLRPQARAVPRTAQSGQAGSDGASAHAAIEPA